MKGKNVWIVQVGSREEFGDLQSFKDRVSSARIHLENSGDLEVQVRHPPGGRVERAADAGLRRRRAVRPEWEPVPDRPLSDVSNPFLRGGRVIEREYVIEYRGKSLLHDFSRFDQTMRQEQPSPVPDGT